MATSGVNVKMGVSGVSQFRADIKKTQDSLKTLDESLKLNEKQFKQTGDAEEYMQTKSELLKGKIEGQKSVIDNCRKALEEMEKKGVDKSSKAFQDMQRQLLRTKGDLLDTENELNNIGAAGETAGDGVDAMNAQLKRIGDGVSYQNVTEGLEKITGGMTKVVQKAWQMGEAIVKATLGAGSWADELKTTAAQYEIDPEQLQRMRKTANLIDTDVDTILSAQQKLRQGVGKKDKEALGAFAALFGEGYDPSKKNAIDAFWDAGEALMKLEDEYDKQVYAQKLFGKSWRELVPLFETGRKEYDKTMDSWSVVENEQLDALGKMDDQYQKMTGEWETFKMEMLSAFSGPLTDGMEKITGLFEQLNKYLDSDEGQEMLTKLGETISTVIDELINVDPETVVGGIKKVVDDVKGGFEWIDENKENIKNALLVIAGGFAALKLGEVAVNIGRVVTGFKGLFGRNGEKAAEKTAEAAGGGGFWTGAGNAVTKLAANANKALLANGLNNLVPVVGDMIINQTNAGRALRDGGNILDGFKQDFEEKAAEVKQNADTFWDDWRNNKLTGWIFELGDKLAEEQKRVYVHTPDMRDLPDLPNDASLEQINEYMEQLNGILKDDSVDKTEQRRNSVRWFNELHDSIDRMNQINKETNETNERTNRNSLTPGDVSEFKGLPAAVARAVENANIQVIVDANDMSQGLTPIMSALLARSLLRN